MATPKPPPLSQAQRDAVHSNRQMVKAGAGAAVYGGVSAYMPRSAPQNRTVKARRATPAFNPKVGVAPRLFNPNVKLDASQVIDLRSFDTSGKTPSKPTPGPPPTRPAPASSGGGGAAAQKKK